MTMKKIIAVLLAITPIFTFAACGNTSSDRADKPTTSTPASADKNTPSTNSNHPNSGKILVVYYSATGSTKAVAQTIAETVGANVFEIAPKDKYSSKDLDWTDSDSRVNAEHNDESKRDIALEKTTLDNWADYDTVFIGYPIWWAIAAWSVNNFVKGNDLRVKPLFRSARPHRRDSVRAVSFWQRRQTQAIGRTARDFLPVLPQVMSQAG